MNENRASVWIRDLDKCYLSDQDLGLGVDEKRHDDINITWLEYKRVTK